MTEAALSAESQPLLEISGLNVDFGDGAVVVQDLSMSVGRGEIVGLVGESGSGKSMTALAVMRLLPAPGRSTGTVTFDHRDLLELPEASMREVRGGRIGIVFQEPMTALNPVFTIGYQIVEAIRVHRAMPKGGGPA